MDFALPDAQNCIALCKNVHYAVHKERMRRGNIGVALLRFAGQLYPEKKVYKEVNSCNRKFVC